MRYILGNPEALRSAASELARFASLASSAKSSMAAAKNQLPLAGTGQAITQLAAVIERHSATCDSLERNAAACAARLRSLADRLEQLDGIATQAAIGPTANERINNYPVQGIPGVIYNQAGVDAARWTAESERSSAATYIDGLLPNGEVRRLVEKKAEPSTFQRIWDNTMGEFLAGLSGLLVAGWDLTLGNIFTADDSARRRDETWQMLSALRRAIVDDEFADGSKGARQEVLTVLGDSVMRKDLLDKDPVAWFVVNGVSLPLLLFGGAGLMQKAPGLVAKLGLKSNSALRLTDLSRLDKDAEKLLSPAQQTIRKVSPKLADVTETSITYRPGIWERSISGYEGRGRHVEDLIFEILQSRHPSLKQLVYNHEKIDIASDFSGRRIVSVKSIDLSASSYANNPGQVESVVRGYARDLRDWGRPVVKDQTSKYSLFWDQQDLSLLSRDLYIGFPPDGLTERHAKAFEKILEEFSSAGKKDPNVPAVNIHLVEIRR